MRDPQASDHSTWTLLTGLLWVVILSDAVAYHPPTLHPDSGSEILYEVCSLGLGLFTLGAIGLFLRRPDPLQHNLRWAFSPVSHGFIVLVGAVILKSAFALSLFLTGDAASPGGLVGDAIIFLLKWAGLGMMARARLRLLWQGKRQSGFLFWPFTLLLAGVVALLFWADLSGLAFWF